MPVRLTYIQNERYELRAPTVIDTIATFVSPSGGKNNITAVDGRVEVVLNKLGTWSCVWPSETVVEIEVVPPLAEIVQDALVDNLPTSRLSSRPA